MPKQSNEAVRRARNNQIARQGAIETVEVRHEDCVWSIRCAEWRRPDGTGELRVYRIEGPVHDPALMTEAFQLEADARGLRWAQE